MLYFPQSRLWYVIQQSLRNYFIYFFEKVNPFTNSPTAATTTFNPFATATNPDPFFSPVFFVLYLKNLFAAK